MSNTNKQLTVNRNISLTEMSESAFQKANKDFAKLFSTAGFSNERSLYYSNNIIRSLKGGLPVNGSKPEVIQLSFSMSEKTSSVIDRFNMIDREKNGGASYIKGAAKGLRTINAEYFRDLKISINMRTGKIRIDRKEIKKVEINTTVLVRGLNSKEAKNILENALDYMNVNKPDKNSKIYDKSVQNSGPGNSQNISRLSSNYNRNPAKDDNSYISRLYTNLKDLLEKIGDSREYSRDLFYSIVRIYDVMVEKNSGRDDVLKFNMDMLAPAGITESGNDNTGTKTAGSNNGKSIQQKNKINLSV
ncbi:hypothetical protein ACFL6G_00940 [candidate division KSB1 bacterium]